MLGDSANLAYRYGKGLKLQPPLQQPGTSPLTASSVQVEVDHITYRNQDNGWTVLKAKDADTENLFTATGFFGAIHAGEQLELIGAWAKHPQYGIQFKIERATPIRPTTVEAIERYLASGLIKGIGPKTAKRIVEHFGAETLDHLDKNPRAIETIPSIKGKKAETIISSWQEQRGHANTMVFLGSHDISPLFASRIIKAYGKETVNIVTKDPYRLAADIKGVGFITADRIAKSLGIAEDSEERIRAAILYLLEMAEDRGHCFLTPEELPRLLADTLTLPRQRLDDTFPRALKTLLQVGSLSKDIVTQNGREVEVIYKSELLIAEWNVAHAIHRLNKADLKVDLDRVRGWIKRYGDAQKATLSDEQLNAVELAASSRVFILTGGPGVGKTTTANTIIRLFKAMGKNVILGAPTGRAAQRLSEVSATPAKTIHRLLEWLPHLSAFSRNENNPLVTQVVIIDEASMLDIRLADALLRAIPTDAQLIFIGDVDQLPSVGPGNVLRDLIDSAAIPTVRLNKIFRQAEASDIIRSAHMVNRGETPPFHLFSPQTDCKFIDADLSDDIRLAIEKLSSRDSGFDPIRDMQVLTPMNRGDIGAQGLNEFLQNLLNPHYPGLPEYKKGGLLLRAGDKVIQCSNNYELGVFNGDIGFIAHAHVSGGKLLVNYPDGRQVAYSDEDAQELKLAYAITIHKSQGSEFKVVIIPCSMAHRIMLQRNLFYTALTRAKKKAYFIGAKKALQYAIQTLSSLKRQTGLQDKIRSLKERG